MHLGYKNFSQGNSLAVQWLGPCAFTAMDLGSIPGWGTKILQAKWRSQNTTPPPNPLWYWCKDRKINQWNIIKNSKVNPPKNFSQNFWGRETEAVRELFMEAIQ